MNIQFYQKLTLLDFPQKTACTVFTYGCNLRCPFCHNAGLVTRPAEEKIDEVEFFKFLDKRKNLLDGVCITGGEPLLQPDIARFISDIKANDRPFALRCALRQFKGAYGVHNKLCGNSLFCITLEIVVLCIHSCTHAHKGAFLHNGIVLCERFGEYDGFN